MLWLLTRWVPWRPPSHHGHKQAKKEAAAKAEADRVAAMDEEERGAYLEAKRKEQVQLERKNRILNRQLKAYGGGRKAKSLAKGGRGRGRGKKRR